MSQHNSLTCCNNNNACNCKYESKIKKKINKPRNNNKKWTTNDYFTLNYLREKNTCVQEIARKLGRSEWAVWVKINIIKRKESQKIKIKRKGVLKNKPKEKKYIVKNNNNIHEHENYNNDILNNDFRSYPPAKKRKLNRMNINLDDLFKDLGKDRAPRKLKLRQ